VPDPTDAASTASRQIRSQLRADLSSRRGGTKPDCDLEDDVRLRQSHLKRRSRSLNRRVPRSVLVLTWPLLADIGAGKSPLSGQLPPASETLRMLRFSCHRDTLIDNHVPLALHIRGSVVRCDHGFVAVRIGTHELRTGPKPPESAASGGSENRRASGGRFELPDPVKGRRFSRPPQSTTLPPLRDNPVLPRSRSTV
jgi:hypothetical protein